MAKRILWGIFVIISGMFLPWWASLGLIVLGAYLLAPWYEILIIALFLDLSFGIPRQVFYNFEFIYTAFSVAIFFVVWFIKRKFLI